MPWRAVGEGNPPFLGRQVAEGGEADHHPVPSSQAAEVGGEGGKPFSTMAAVAVVVVVVPWADWALVGEVALLEQWWQEVAPPYSDSPSQLCSPQFSRWFYLPLRTPLDSRDSSDSLLHFLDLF